MCQKLHTELSSPLIVVFRGLARSWRHSMPGGMRKPNRDRRPPVPLGAFERIWLRRGKADRLLGEMRHARASCLSVLAFLFFAFVNAGLGRRSPPDRHHRRIPTISASTCGPSRTSRSTSARRPASATRQCRAFTYNTKAKWCFLKSDFATHEAVQRRGRRQGRADQRRPRHRRAAGARLSSRPGWSTKPPVSARG